VQAPQLYTRYSIQPKKIFTMNIPPGKHDVVISDDIYGSNHLTVLVSEGRTVNLTWGYNFRGTKRLAEELRQFRRKSASTKDMYFLKQIDSP
jgi:hypothetical protein